MQFFVHYFLHLIFPWFIARIIFKTNWKHAYFVLLLTMLVDLDHLLVQPIFQTDRCSIDFHLLHSRYLFPLYILLIFFKGDLRIIGIGLCLHMLTDLIDCLFMFSHCPSCYTATKIYPVLKLLKGLTTPN